jgi:TonB family protein
MLTNGFIFLDLYLNSSGMYTASLFFLLFTLFTATSYFFRFLMDKKSKNNSTDKIYHDSKRNKYKDFLLNSLVAFTLTFIVQSFQELTHEPDYIQECFLPSPEMMEQINNEEVFDCNFDLPPPPSIIESNCDGGEIEDDDIEIVFNCFDFEEEAIECFIEIEEEQVEEEWEEGLVCMLVVETPAQPIGGYVRFYKFIKENLKYPKTAKKQGLEGKVFVQFIVQTSGELTNVEVVKGLSPSLNEEAVRVLKLSPNWTVGKQRGVPVKQRIVVPIVFKLNSESVFDEEIEDIYVIVDEPAEPVKGYEKLHKKISQKVKIPKKMRQVSFEGRVFVQVIINKKGKMYDAKILKGINQDLDKEVLKTVNKFAKKWKPAKHNGQFVKQKIVLPIKIKS